jgi:hypothetical protein
MPGGWNERPESALHYAGPSFQHPDVGATSRIAPTGICRTAADNLHGHHHDDHGAAGQAHHRGRRHAHAPANLGNAILISLNTVLVGGLRGSTVVRQGDRTDRTCAGDRWTSGGGQADRLGWLKMVVEAERVTVLVDILCRRLMAPKNGFVVVHGAVT